MSMYCHLYSVSRMSKVLGVSRSGFYKSLKAHIGKRVLEDARLLTLIQAAYHQSRMTYGSPRIHAVLKDEGIICSQKRVARLMRQHKLVSITKKNLSTRVGLLCIFCHHMT